MASPLKRAEDEEQRRELLRPTSSTSQAGSGSYPGGGPDDYPLQEHHATGVVSSAHIKPSTSGLLQAKVETIKKIKKKLTGRGSTLLSLSILFTINSVILQVTAVLLPRWAIMRTTAGNAVNASVGLWDNCTMGMHNILDGEVCESLEAAGIEITGTFQAVRAFAVLSVVLVVGALITGFLIYTLNRARWIYITNIVIRALLCIFIIIAIGLWKDKIAYFAASMGGCITLQLTTIAQELLDLALVVGAYIRFHGPWKQYRMCKPWC